MLQKLWLARRSLRAEVISYIEPNCNQICKISMIHLLISSRVVGYVSTRVVSARVIATFVVVLRSGGSVVIQRCPPSRRTKRKGFEDSPRQQNRYVLNIHCIYVRFAIHAFRWHGQNVVAL